MSRSLWRCRNRACLVLYGAVLGRVTADGGLTLASTVVSFRVHLDTRRVMVQCPSCGQTREFRGNALFSARAQLTASQ
jgi:hypothetical protein